MAFYYQGVSFSAGYTFSRFEMPVRILRSHHSDCTKYYIRRKHKKDYCWGKVEQVPDDM
jgi:hypothetical protein